MPKHKPRTTALSTREAAERLEVDVQIVKNLFDQGQLEGWRTPGGHRRISASSIEAFKKAREQPVRTPSGGMRGGARAPVDPRKRIVWIDDDPAFLVSVGRQLRFHEKEYDVSLVDNGVAGIMDVATMKPNLLVLDLAMPGIDGYEVLRRLREQPGTEGLLIAVVTGTIDKHAKRKALEAGANAFFVKPFAMKDVLALVAGPELSE